jgi:hypothetical protein
MRLSLACAVILFGFVACGGDDDLDVPAATPKDAATTTDAGMDASDAD